MHVILPRLPGRLAMPCAVASGAVLWLAFPPTGWWPLAFVGVALLSVATSGQRTPTAFGLGLVAGFAFYLPLLDWLQNVGVHAWLILALTQAVATGLLGVVLRWTARLSWWPVAHACLWVAFEAVRGRYPLGGFTWGRLAFSQSRSPLAPLAAIGGAPLVTGAVAALAMIGLYAAIAAGRRSGLPAPRALGAGVATVAVIAVGSLAVPVPSRSDRTLTVAAIQGNVPALGLDATAEDLVVVGNHADATAKLARDVRAGTAPPPDLVVWPESSTDIDPRRDDVVRRLVVDSAAAVNAPILVGAVLDTDDGRILNAGLMWDPQTGAGQIYSKQHLVPFGEYVPWRRLIGKRVKMLDEYIPRNFVAGSRSGVFDVAGTRVGDVICFEIAYDGLVRDTVRAGAQLLIVQTNNATYMRGRDAAQTEQQLEMGRLRAIEHGRAVVVAATSGVSALIAPDGTTIARSSVFTQEQLIAALPVRSALSISDRVGVWPEMVLCLIAVASLAAARRSARAATADQRADRQIAHDDAIEAPEPGRVS